MTTNTSKSRVKQLGYLSPTGESRKATSSVENTSKLMRIIGRQASLCKGSTDSAATLPSRYNRDGDGPCLLKIFRQPTSNQTLLTWIESKRCVKLEKKGHSWKEVLPVRLWRRSPKVNLLPGFFCGQESKPLVVG